MKNSIEPLETIINLAENVRRHRKSREQTMSEFAGNCGISVYMLRNIENGRGCPTLKHIDAIADYVGCPAYELLQPKEYCRMLILR